ncbi:hypothetical protein ACTWQF_36510 [Streptomyces sp. 8N114]|uniref:hypothetical protein n=1 Tax=Streptomyces sp. 8N114 TaxID=3457419 RepID=UPI003FD49446
MKHWTALYGMTHGWAAPHARALAQRRAEGRTPFIESARDLRSRGAVAPGGSARAGAGAAR